MKLICAVFLFMGVSVSAAPATPSDPAPQTLRCWDDKDQNGGDPGFVLEQSEHSAAIYFILISILFNMSFQIMLPSSHLRNTILTTKYPRVAVWAPGFFTTR